MILYKLWEKYSYVIILLIIMIFFSFLSIHILAVESVEPGKENGPENEAYEYVYEDSSYK